MEDPQVGCPLTVRHVDCERLMKINAAIARLITSILFQPAGHNMALCARAVRHFENFADCSGGHRPSYPEAGNTDEHKGEEMKIAIFLLATGHLKDLGFETLWA